MQAQAPSLVLNNPTSNSRQQVPLRDYLNTRLAPFLKKAITESLDKEAEFPLQWLGECLINQSILYEGNTDPTGIQERFRYTFDVPKPIETGPEQTEVQMEAETNGMPTAVGSEGVQVQEAAVNGENEKATEGQADQSVPGLEQAAGAQTEVPVPVSSVGVDAGAGAGADTEMGGTA